MNVSRFVLVATFVLLLPCGGKAGPIYSDPSVGGNGHYYDRIDTPNLTWLEANEIASGLMFNNLSGHLVTITSAEEQTFLANNISVNDGNKWFWLGGYQDTSAPDYIEPADGWRWVTGETFSYTNWNQSTNPNQNQPNNNNGNPENFLATFNVAWKWNDLPNTQSTTGFIVEYEATAVPEPATIHLMLLAGILGFAILIFKISCSHPILGGRDEIQ